jgi:hypothetical protein
MAKGNVDGGCKERFWFTPNLLGTKVIGEDTERR